MPSHNRRSLKLWAAVLTVAVTAELFLLVVGSFATVRLFPSFVGFWGIVACVVIIAARELYKLWKDDHLIGRLERVQGGLDGNIERDEESSQLIRQLFTKLRLPNGFPSVYLVRPSPIEEIAPIVAAGHRSLVIDLNIVRDFNPYLLGCLIAQRVQFLRPDFVIVDLMLRSLRRANSLFFVLAFSFSVSVGSTLNDAVSPRWALLIIASSLLYNVVAARRWRVMIFRADALAADLLARSDIASPPAAFEEPELIEALQGYQAWALRHVKPVSLADILHVQSLADAPPLAARSEMLRKFS